MAQQGAWQGDAWILRHSIREAHGCLAKLAAGASTRSAGPADAQAAMQAMRGARAGTGLSRMMAACRFKATLDMSPGVTMGHLNERGGGGMLAAFQVRRASVHACMRARVRACVHRLLWVHHNPMVSLRASCAALHEHSLHESPPHPHTACVHARCVQGCACAAALNGYTCPEHQPPRCGAGMDERQA